MGRAVRRGDSDGVSLLVDPTALRPAPPPGAVVASVVLWLGALLAGLSETLVRLAGPLPPSGAEVAFRSAVYTVLVVLVVQLRSGSAVHRWTVVGVLGLLGTASLVAEPLRALAGGTTVAGFLADASSAELLAASLRALHVVEVVAAMSLLFHPAARAFYRSGPGGRVAR